MTDEMPTLRGMAEWTPDAGVLREMTGHLALLEMKVGALDQAAPLQGWALPGEFPTLRRLPEARLSGRNRCAAGEREHVQVLRLRETFPMAAVHGAVVDALRLGPRSATTPSSIWRCAGSSAVRRS